MEQITNKEIIERLNQMQKDIDIIKGKLSEEEPLSSVEEQLEMGLKDMREGKIMRLA